MAALLLIQDTIIIHAIQYEHRFLSLVTKNNKKQQQQNLKKNYTHHKTEQTQSKRWLGDLSGREEVAMLIFSVCNQDSIETHPSLFPQPLRCRSRERATNERRWNHALGTRKGATRVLQWPWKESWIPTEWNSARTWWRQLKRFSWLSGSSSWSGACLRWMGENPVVLTPIDWAVVCWIPVGSVVQPFFLSVGLLYVFI